MTPSSKINRSFVMVCCALLAMVIPEFVYAANPAEAKTVGRIISQRPDLSSFQKVLEKAQLGSQLAERTNLNYTVFAPNNKAFESLAKEDIETLLDPRNDDRLEEVFNFHVFNRAEPPFELEKFRTLNMIRHQYLQQNSSKALAKKRYL